MARPRKKIQKPEPKGPLPGALESAFADAMDGLIADAEGEVDIITFAESPQYLNLAKDPKTGRGLMPQQAFILKCYYGLTLDDKEPCIQVRHFPGDAKGDLLTEAQYAQFLIRQQRCNVSEEWLKKPWRLQDLVLACGRRGGKSVLSAVISCYEAYRLIVKGDPQRHYGVMRGQIIKIVNLATAASQAQELLELIKDMIFASAWFEPYIDSATTTEVRLKTREDLRREREAKKRGLPEKEYRSILVESLACSAAGSRGGTIMVVILDEFAHFTDGSGNRAGGSILEAIVPSTATFGMDARILCLSSPYNKGGAFYSRFKKGMGDPEKGIEPFEKPTGVDEGGIRCFRIPTWEMNPKITFSYLLSRLQSSDSDDFEWEYAAEFSTTVTGFFKYPERIDNIRSVSRERERDSLVMTQRSNVPHYIAVDPASVGHGYALCMGHVEMFPTQKVTVSGGRERVAESLEPFVVIDRWRRWLSEDPEFDDCAETDKGIKIMDPKVVETFIINELKPNFRVAKIFYDQFESAGSVNEFHRRGIQCVRKPFTTRHNMAIYSALENIVYEGRLLIAEDVGTDLGLDELRFLQKIRGNRKTFRVEAQKEGDVTTDDLADVLANVVYHLVTDKALQGTARAVGLSGSGKPVGGQKGAKVQKNRRAPTNMERLRASDPRYGRWKMAGWRGRGGWSRGR